MRWVALLLCSCTGCSEILIHHKTAPTSDPLPAMAPLGPSDVEYELLGNGVGDACSIVGEHEAIEGAKFAALQQLRTADGLFGVRAKIEKNGDQFCATVIGRGYRIKSITPRRCGDAMHDASGLQPVPQLEQK